MNWNYNLDLRKVNLIQQINGNHNPIYGEHRIHIYHPRDLSSIHRVIRHNLVLDLY